MRIFYAFLIIVVSAMLFMLPVAEAIYDFRTLLREDVFTSPTGAVETTANVTLVKPVYTDDTSTIDILSDLTTDVPITDAYDTATRELQVGGLTANTTRVLTITYDADALSASGSLNTMMDNLPFMWMLTIIAFPMAALFAIFTGRV